MYKCFDFRAYACLPFSPLPSCMYCKTPTRKIKCPTQTINHEEDKIVVLLLHYILVFKIEVVVMPKYLTTMAINSC